MMDTQSEVINIDVDYKQLGSFHHNLIYIYIYINRRFDGNFMDIVWIYVSHGEFYSQH